MNGLVKWWPIVFRAGLYFLIEALPSLIKGCHEFGEDAKHVNAWVIGAIGLDALYHGCVGLRAYTDGSFHRLRDSIRQHSGDTDFLTKQATKS